jgi:hypothetical protein
MTGVRVPVGVLGSSVILSNHVARGTLPFTGIALGLYAAIGFCLLLTGIALRVVSRTRRPQSNCT